MIYLSKRDTPLTRADAVAILRLSGDGYGAALAAGRLRRSVRIANDPTDRFAFHSFWDLLEFSLSQGAPEGAEAAGGDGWQVLVAELCDHLAEGDEDLAVGTGDPGTDLAILRHGWAGGSDLGALPEGVLGRYATLLLRTLGHVHAVAAATASDDGALLAPTAHEPVLIG